MKSQVSYLCSRLAIAAAAVLLLLPAAAHAQDVLSERLTDQIWEMNKTEIIHKLDGELERRKAALEQEATVERANYLRKVLKTRAGIYEALDDISRAELEYNEFVDVKPTDPMVYIDRGYFYMRQGQFNAALRDFTTGSRLAPAQPAFSYG